MAIGMGQARAWLNLGYRFGTHVLLRMPLRMFRRGSDARRFAEAVIPEGYVPLLPSERALMPAAMRCINCGLCAIAGDIATSAPDAPPQPASAWDEAWTFVAGPSRSLDRAPLVAAGLTDAASPAAGAVCPAGVPIDALAHTLRRLAGEESA